MMSSGIRVSPIEAPATKATSSTGERPRARATHNATGWTARAGARPRPLAEVEFRQRPGHQIGRAPVCTPVTHAPIVCRLGRDTTATYTDWPTLSLPDVLPIVLRTG